ncbi:MAG: YicC family protein [Pirellulales bacterium]|nr:YicC family protein [Pirellulales bacterium]
MLLSMTGYGEARLTRGGTTVGVELRTVNNRFFKLAYRCDPAYAALEPEIEALVRSRIHRGTVHLSLLVERTQALDAFRIDGAVLHRYLEQVRDIERKWNLPERVPLAALLSLPGAIATHTLTAGDLAEDWPLVRETVEEAMERLTGMRRQEGLAMAQDLRANLAAMLGVLDQIAERAPQVVEGYRDRLAERVKALLAEYQVSLQPAELIKEVSLFAERSDISEELVRLRSHVLQFQTLVDQPEPAGRKLEFLAQEMFREANTIGSKANDVDIARLVIDMKAAIERIREMIQNVE